MKSAKPWLLAVLLMGSFGGAMMLGASPTFAQRDARRDEQSYWRHHNGRWSHWDARDKRWYYTDGQHWYYHNGKTWAPYRFDKSFGREHFERGGYVVPGDKVKVVVPQHEVYVHPR